MDEDTLTPDEQKLIETLMAEVFPTMTRAFGTPKCCLAASRAVVEALRAVGITANPVPVQVMALPPKLTARMHEEGRPPADDAERLEWQDGQMIHGIAFNRSDIDHEKTNAFIGGHCAVMMLSRSGQHVLIDPSLGQINYPDDGIVLGAIYMTAPPEFAKGDLVAETQRGDVLLQYEAHPEHQSYLETPAYTAPDNDPFHPVSAAVFHFKRRAREVAGAS